MIIPHEITSPLKCGGAINVSTITPKKYYAGIQNACLQCCGGVGCSPKLFESFFSLPKILFENIFELTHISKTEPKSCLKNFQISLKIN